MRFRALMRYSQSFPTVIPLYEAGYPRVTHPSATKLKTILSEEIQVVSSVRLACVKHAASVHPEPGSNSHVKVCSGHSKAWLLFNRFLLFLKLVHIYSKNQLDFSRKIFLIFQGYFTVQLSRFFACLLLPHQRQLI